MEIKMRNTALIVIGALLITCSTVQMSTASEHHARKASRDFRGTYNQLNVPSEAERNIENFGFSGMDRSRVGGEDPSLKPSGS
jgi:hypothetical protein